MYVHKLEKEYGCPLEAALEVVSGKWKTRIVGTLDTKGTVRFGDIKKNLSGVSDAVLCSVLKEMQTTGIIERIAYDEIPPRVEYSLTKAGKELVPIFKSLCIWWQENQDKEVRCANQHCRKCLNNSENK